MAALGLAENGHRARRAVDLDLGAVLDDFGGARAVGDARDAELARDDARVRKGRFQNRLIALVGGLQGT